MNILIPMAGAGSRFSKAGYEDPKPLIDVKGKPMIQRVIETLDMFGHYIFVVREYEDESHNKRLEKILKKCIRSCTIIRIRRLTDGAAQTCLLAERYINNDQPLIITNCDQVFDWEPADFLRKTDGVDGVVHTYDSSDPKNSFVELDEEGMAVRFVEKQPISNHALTGFHYWRRGQDFVASAKEMIAANERSNNEFYVSTTYNYLVKRDFKISTYPMEKSQTVLIGTPEDLDEYIGSL